MQTISEHDPLKYGLVVRLSPDEVKVLRDVLLSTGGDPKRRRRHVDEMLTALQQAGVPLNINPAVTGNVCLGS